MSTKVWDEKDHAADEGMNMYLAVTAAALTGDLSQLDHEELEAAIEIFKGTGDLELADAAQDALDQLPNPTGPDMDGDADD